MAPQPSGASRDRGGGPGGDGAPSGNGRGRDSYDWERALELFERIGLKPDQIRTLSRMARSDKTLHHAARECWEDRRNVRNPGAWIYTYAKRTG